VAAQDSQNFGRDFAKRKQTDAEFEGNSLLRTVIIHIVSNTLLGRVIRHPAGMHCPSWDDAFVSSLISVVGQHSFVQLRIMAYLLVLTRLLVVMLCSYVTIFISQQLISNLARLPI